MHKLICSALLICSAHLLCSSALLICSACLLCSPARLLRSSARPLFTYSQPWRSARAAAASPHDTSNGALSTANLHSIVIRSPPSAALRELPCNSLANCCATSCTSWRAVSGAKGSACGVAQGDSQSGGSVCEARGTCASNAPARGARLVPGDENCCGAMSCLLLCPACCALHVVEVEHREARAEVGGNARSAELAMPSARGAASCAASPGAGRSSSRARGGKHFLWLRRGFFLGGSI